MTRRTIPIIAILSIAAAAAAPAWATPGGLDATFGNTLEVTYPDGQLARLWLDRDGSYRGANRQGRPSSGHWTIRADKLCMKQKRPLPVPFSYCTPIVAGGVGASWLGRAVGGETVRIRLVAGR
jgi:hypothetical protein